MTGETKGVAPKLRALQTLMEARAELNRSMRFVREAGLGVEETARFEAEIGYAVLIVEGLEARLSR